MFLIINLLMVICLLVFRLHLVKQQMGYEQKNLEKTLETIEILLEEQIKRCEDDKEKNLLLIEIAKYIKDFLMSEIRNKRFVENGLLCAAQIVRNEVPNVDKHYKCDKRIDLQKEE